MSPTMTPPGDRRIAGFRECNVCQAVSCYQGMTPPWTINLLVHEMRHGEIRFHFHLGGLGHPGGSRSLFWLFKASNWPPNLLFFSHRNCIGQKFAMNEMKCILAHILRRYTFHSMEHLDKVVVQMEMVLRPKTPLKVMVKDRRAKTCHHPAERATMQGVTI